MLVNRLRKTIWLWLLWHPVLEEMLSSLSLQNWTLLGAMLPTYNMNQSRKPNYSAKRTISCNFYGYSSWCFVHIFLSSNVISCFLLKHGFSFVNTDLVVSYKLLWQFDFGFYGTLLVVGMLSSRPQQQKRTRLNIILPTQDRFRTPRLVTSSASHLGLYLRASGQLG